MKLYVLTALAVFYLLNDGVAEGNNFIFAIYFTFSFFVEIF